MVPADDHNFVGDVYILQGDEIVGVVEAIVFTQWPCIMLDRFFRPPATESASQALDASHFYLPLASLGSSATTPKMQSVQPSVFTGDYKNVTGLLTPPSPARSVQPQESKYELSSTTTAASDSLVRAFEIIAEEIGDRRPYANG